MWHGTVCRQRWPAMVVSCVKAASLFGPGVGVGRFGIDQVWSLRAGCCVLGAPWREGLRQRGSIPAGCARWCGTVWTMAWVWLRPPALVWVVVPQVCGWCQCWGVSLWLMFTHGLVFVYRWGRGRALTSWPHTSNRVNLGPFWIWVVVPQSVVGVSAGEQAGAVGVFEVRLCFVCPGVCVGGYLSAACTGSPLAHISEESSDRHAAGING
jgi:hypothetical protein